MMNSIRKWLYKPKKTDSALLAQFYFADEELNAVAAELDSFDSRKDPERCTALVTQLRGCQDKVLNIIHRMMNEAIPYSRTSRDFRVKFPDDVVQENLAGQLWFGAECLAAGSSIMNREMESASMRPLARALTKNLDSLRCILREQSLTNVIEYTERIQEALTIFDKLFADFELRYVSAMVPVKSVKEYETIQEITVLFSETVIRAKKLGYITTDMIDEYDPALMFTIPRLAIVCGLLIYSDGPLNPDSQSWNMSDMFRPFQTLLYKIRELLYTLSEAELLTLERALCSQEEPEFLASSTSGEVSTAAATSTSDTGVQTDELPSKVCGDSEDAQSLDSSEKSLEACREVDLLPPLGDGDRYVSSSDSLGGGSVSPESGASESCRDGCRYCTADRPPEVEASGRPRSLNKCDSSDSGLHSEVISNSDSLHTMSSSNSHQLLSHSTMSSPPLSPFDDEQSNLVTGEESHFPLGHVQEKDFTVDDQCNLVRTFLETASGMSPGDSPEHLAPHLPSPVNAACRLGESSVAREKVEEDEEESFYSASPGESPLHVSRLSRTSSAHPAAPSEGYLQTQVTNEKVSQTKDAEFPNTYCDFSPSQDCCDDVSGQHAFTVSISCLPAYERQEVDNEDRINRSSEEERTFSGCLESSDQDKMQGAHVANVNFDMAGCSDHGNKTQGDREEDSWQELDTPFQNAPMLWTSGESNGLEDNSVHGGIFLHLKETDDGEVKVKGEEVGATCKCGRIIVEELGRDSNVSVHGSVPCLYEARENCEVEMTGVGEGPEGGQVVGDSCSQGQCDRCTQTPQSAINNSHSSKILHHHHHHHYHHHHHHHHSLLQQCPSPVPDTGCSAEFHASCHKCDRIKANTKESSNSKLNKLPPDQSTGRHSEQSEVNATTIKISSKSSCNHGKTVTVRQSGTKKDFATVDPSLSSKQCADSSSNCSSSSEGDTRGWSTEGGVHERQGDPPCPEAASASSGCEPTSSASDCDCEWEGDSCSSSETSSYNSECHDDEEIALAVQAAELASRNQARARFRSSSDMIHRLFVCISGVADQLQTNFAGDLRNILRVVFNLHCSEPVVMEEEKFFTRRRRGSTFRQGFNTGIPQNQGFRGIREPPPWIPDDQSTMCMSCKTSFTFVRRRHHCRNCGKIFCGRCSSNAVSLPHFGHSKPVRVCNRCFMFQVTPFTMQAQ